MYLNSDYVKEINLILNKRGWKKNKERLPNLLHDIAEEIGRREKSALAEWEKAIDDSSIADGDLPPPPGSPNANSQFSHTELWRMAKGYSQKEELNRDLKRLIRSGFVFKLNKRKERRRLGRPGRVESERRRGRPESRNYDFSLLIQRSWWHEQTLSAQMNDGPHQGGNEAELLDSIRGTIPFRVKNDVTVYCHPDDSRLNIRKRILPSLVQSEGDPLKVDIDNRNDIVVILTIRSKSERNRLGSRAAQPSHRHDAH